MTECDKSPHDKIMWQDYLILICLMVCGVVGCSQTNSPGNDDNNINVSGSSAVIATSLPSNIAMPASAAVATSLPSNIAMPATPTMIPPPQADALISAFSSIAGVQDVLTASSSLTQADVPIVYAEFIVIPGTDYNGVANAMYLASAAVLSTQEFAEVSMIIDDGVTAISYRLDFEQNIWDVSEMTAFNDSRQATLMPVANSQSALTTPTIYYVKIEANLRACPQTSCTLVDTYYAGAALEIVDDNVSGDVVSGSTQWMQGIVNGQPFYVHSSLISRSQPAPTPIPQQAAPAPQQNVPIAPPVNIQPAAPNASACSCAANTLNCDDFTTGQDANACYNKCIAETGRDVHGLDGNDDGLACESS